MRIDEVRLWVGLTLSIILINILSVQIGAVHETRVPEPIVGELRFNPGQEVQFANVDSGDDNNVIFTGVVNCELVAGGTYEHVSVYLNASTTKGWNTTVNPKKVNFAPNTDTNIPFWVTVMVPYGTLTNEPDTVTITGNYIIPEKNLTGGLSPMTGSIYIRQYYDYEVNTKQSPSTVESGKRISYLINITNNGNGWDIYRISIKNIENLLNSGIEVTFSETKVEIEPMASKEVKVNVKTSKDTKEGNHGIIIVVKSDVEETTTGFTIPEEENLYFRTESSLDEEAIYFSIIGIVAVVVLIIILVLFYIERRKKKGHN